MCLFAAHQQAEGYLRRVLAHLLPIAAQDVNFCVCNSLNILSLAVLSSIVFLLCKLHLMAAQR